jgi:phosphate/sulfate permease
MNFPIDLVFLNDESDNVSPEEWNTSLTVISDIVDAFTIGANDVRVGLAAYSDTARTDE